MSKVMIFSADGHAALPLEAYRPYLEKTYLPAFEESLEARRQVSVDFTAIHDPETIKPWEQAFLETGRIEARWDMDRRLREIEAEGIVGEVLFPDGAPFGAGGFGGMHKPFARELERAGARAYNRWLADFVAEAPGRFAGQAILVLDDIDSAIADVRWAAEHGLQGVMMPGIDADIPLYWDTDYDPLWAACSEANIPLNFHGGIGMPALFHEATNIPIRARLRIAATEFGWYAHRPFWWMVWSGVLERFPELRLVFTEQHTDWLPGLLRTMDHSYQHSRYAPVTDYLPHPPSFYWERQCWVGSSVLSKGDVDVRGDVGIGRMMFGADFPHPEGTWMGTLNYLRATVARSGMNETESQQFLGANAVRVFGVNAELLGSLAEQYGPEMSDVLTPLDEESVVEMFQRTDVVRPSA